jgi:hypothetical protein
LRPAQANTSQDPMSKITRAKRTRGVAQVVECLLCKCKALSTNPSPTKKKRKKRKFTKGRIRRNSFQHHTHRHSCSFLVRAV